MVNSSPQLPESPNTDEERSADDRRAEGMELTKDAVVVISLDPGDRDLVRPEQNVEVVGEDDCREG